MSRCNFIQSTFLLTALASSAAALGDESGDRPQIEEEIYVTSNKRQTPLSEAPVAVSTASSRDLESTNIDRLEDFNAFVPGLLISKNDGAGRVASLRGVGWETAQNLSTQPGVLLYVDGVYVANPLALGTDLDAVERVEIFRGPQGTEFGQSAVGGAVNVVTKSPVLGQLTTDLNLAFGSFDRIDLGAAVNAPLGERTALRASLRSLDRSGYAEIQGGTLGGFELEDRNSLAGRVDLQWSSGPESALRLSAYRYRSDQHGAAQRHRHDPSLDARRLTQDFPSTFRLDSSRYSAAFNWTASSNLFLQSTSGWQHLKKRQTVDGDRLTEDLVAVDLTGFGPANFDVLPVWDNNSQAFSHETTLFGSRHRLDWLAGVFYLRHANDNFFVEVVGPAPFSQFEESVTNPSPETLPPFVPPLEFVEDRTVTRWDGAAYAQTTIHLSSTFDLVVGGRYQSDRALDETTQFWFIESEQRTRDTQWTWKLSGNLAPSPHWLLFAALSTGWKNGGLNPGALVGGAEDVPPVFAPEEVLLAELGWRFARPSGRVAGAVTLFHSDYDNYQFIQEDPIPFAAGTGNIPKVEITGVEAELTWTPNDSWRLEGQVSAYDGEIVSDFEVLDVVDFLNSGVGRFLPGSVEGRRQLRTSLAGNRPAKLPDALGRLSAIHRQETDGGCQWTSRIDIVHRGEFQYRVFNHPAVDTVPGYTTVAISFDRTPATRPWSTGVVLSNLLDNDGVNSRFTNPFGLHTTSDEFIPPREVVVRFRYRF